MRTQQVYLVTAGVDRMGKAIVEALVGEGNLVVAHYHTQEQEALALKQACSSQVKCVYADLSEVTGVDHFFDAVLACFGRLDGIINNASWYLGASIEETLPEQFSTVMDVHCAYPFFLAKRFFCYLKENQREGSIVNITDTKAEQGYGKRSAYLQAKAALLMQTRILASSLSPLVRVNAVAPGPILPNGMDVSYFQRMEKILPLQRTGTPSDLTDAVLYLLHATYVTGETLHVDGGEHLL
ncbi:MAG: SDR family oxidoreductase [Sphaerochaetaceae bacterium]